MLIIIMISAMPRKDKTNLKNNKFPSRNIRIIIILLNVLYYLSIPYLIHD